MREEGGYVSFVSDSKEIWDSYSNVSGTLAYDVGANGGMTAEIFAEHFETILAFEPAAESFKRLVATAPPNVKPLPFALSDHDGTVTLRSTTLTPILGELFTGHSLPWGEPQGERTLDCFTLDTIMGEYGRPDFLKIDTEGHECRVLEGGNELFSESVQFVIEVHSERNGAQVMEFLSAHGQKFHEVRHIYNPNSYAWVNHYFIVSDI